MRHLAGRCALLAELLVWACKCLTKGHYAIYLLIESSSGNRYERLDS